MKIKNATIGFLSFLIVVSLSSCGVKASFVDYGTETTAIQVENDTKKDLREYLEKYQNEDIVVSEETTEKYYCYNANIAGRTKTTTKRTLSLDNESNNLLEKYQTNMKEKNFSNTYNEFRSGYKNKTKYESKKIWILEDGIIHSIDLTSCSVRSTNPSNLTIYENMTEMIYDVLESYWFNALKNKTIAYENNGIYTIQNDNFVVIGGDLYSGIEYEKVGGTVIQISFMEDKIVLVKEEKTSFERLMLNLETHIETREITKVEIKQKEVNQKKYKLSDYIVD